MAFGNDAGHSQLPMNLQIQLKEMSLKKNLYDFWV